MAVAEKAIKGREETCLGKVARLAGEASGRDPAGDVRQAGEERQPGEARQPRGAGKAGEGG